MKQKVVRGLILSACVCAAAVAVAGQQPARAPRRGGGLDSLSLSSTAERAAAASAGAQWQTFAPEGVGFSVSLPGVPEEPTQARREQGRLSGQIRTYRLTVGGLKYEVMRTGGLPEQLMSQPDFAEKFFVSMTPGLSAALQVEHPQLDFRLISQQPVSLAGYEGREYEFAAAGHRAVVRLFLIERAIYGLSVLGGKSEMTPDKVNRFFDSFALAQ